MSQLRNIVKKAAVIGLCICTFSVQVSGATPWSSANGIFYDGNGNEIKGAIAKGIDVRVEIEEIIESIYMDVFSFYRVLLCLDVDMEMMKEIRMT